MTTTAIRVLPLTPERWPDLERLFGPRGAIAGCWCMWWRLTSSEFERGAGDDNRAALRALVDDGHVPGLIAYDADEPVGWCSLGPRAEFGRLNRSRNLSPVDDEPVCSLVCFFIPRARRGEGIARVLLDAAVEHAAAAGHSIVEGYPVDAEDVRANDAFTGVPVLFERAGFTEVARRSPRRPIVRRTIRPQ